MFFKKKKWLITLFLGIALLVFIITRLSLKELIFTLTGVNYRYLIMGLFLGFLPTIFRSLRFWYFFRNEGKGLLLIGVFSVMRLMNTIFPMRSGEFIFLKLLKNKKLSPSISETLSVWLFLRMLDVLALSLFFVAFIGLSEIRVHFQKVLIILGIVIVVIIALISCLQFFKRRKKINSAKSWIANRINVFKDGFHRIKGIFAFIWTLILSILIWGSLIMTLVMGLLAFNTPLDMGKCFIAALIGLTFSILPIHAPFGIGTGEAMWSGILITLGVHIKEALAIVIAIRLFTICIILINSFVGLFIIRCQAE